MVAFIVLVVIPGLLMVAAWNGLLGERAQRWMIELNEDGEQDRIRRQLSDANDASAAAHRDARGAMNEAAGQEWRNMTEWRDD